MARHIAAAADCCRQTGIEYLFACLALCLATPAAVAADWPMYRKDAVRSAITEEELKLPLQQAWVYKCAQKPAPAWPEPVKTLNRLDFDYAPHPVVAGGIVCFGSTADDTVRALDAATGILKWRFTTGGPVRFAPQIVNGKVYFASDDGQAYCLNAADGKPVWVFNAAPAKECLIGNKRMISRWPVRTGVLVDNGVVYLAAGTWAAEGVHVYALEADSGRIIWRNDTSGTLTMRSAHGGEYTLSGVCPQGALLADQNILLIPTGRCVPAAYDRKTGKLLYYNLGISNCAGSTWCTVSGNSFYTFAKSFYSPLNVAAFSLQDGKRTGQRFHFRRIPQLSTYGKGKTRKMYSVFRAGKVCALIQNGNLIAREAYGLAMAGGNLVVGRNGGVGIMEGIGGRQLWQQKVSGQARELAVADGRLYVGTSEGEIVCFASGAGESRHGFFRRGSHTAKAAAPRKIRPDRRAAGVLKTLRDAGMDYGYALLLGDKAGRMALPLAKQTRLNIVSVLRDSGAVISLRNRLLDTTKLYGMRIHVWHVEDNKPLPFAQYFANAVIVMDDLGKMPATELYRVLRPCGGILLFPGLRAQRALALANTCGALAGDLIGKQDNVRVVRGRLPGAVDWNTKNASEHLTRWPLRLLWFGEPGVDDVWDRKARRLPPVGANGLFFTRGESRDQGVLTAVDAYNGFLLWRKTTPLGQGLRADDKHVYIVLGKKRYQAYDARTGEKRATYGVAGKKDELSADLPPFLEKRPGYARVDAKLLSAARIHPLTGQRGAKIYTGTFGCGGWANTATSNIMRSGTLAIYDYADDSGMRHFGGLSPSCGGSTTAAMGVLFSVEGRGGCECSYNFQTSIVLAAAERRLNEDWAIFHDHAADTMLRQAQLNFGAPGDRRDGKGNLWLGFPRPMIKPKALSFGAGRRVPSVVNTWTPPPVALPVPLTLDGEGSYYANADITAVSGTDRPWLYASGYSGIKKASLRLNFLKPLTTQETAQAPKINGVMDEELWQGEPQAQIDFVTAKIFLRHDKSNLYVGVHRDVFIGRKGNPTRWNKKVKKDDGKVWSDHAVELFLSDGRAERVYHFAVNAAGTRYDALAAKPGVRENSRWDGEWQSGVVADEKGFVAEFAIPWKTLAGKDGLRKETLAINIMSGNRHNVWKTLVDTGHLGRMHCQYFIPLGIGKPVELKPRRFTVRLHFAEIEHAKPGERVFDVKIQGKRVLKKFDIVKESGGVCKAVVREFTGVQALDRLTLEFSPSAKLPPILSALELRDESFTIARPGQK